MNHEQAFENIDRLVDGELDESVRMEVEAHAASCPICAAAQRSRHAVSSAAAQAGLYYRAPAGMKERLLARIAPAGQTPFARRPLFGDRLTTGGLIRRWAGLSATAAVLALAIASSLAWLAPLPGGDPMYQFVIDSYKASVAAGGSVDLATYHPAAIDAWLKDRMALPAPIQEVPPAIVLLNGARTETLGDRKVAALVYRVGPREIDLYEWPDPLARRTEPMIDQVGAYTVAHWSNDGTQYWVATETHDNTVVNLRRLVEYLSAWPAS